MIRGIGIDVIEVDRIKKIIEAHKERFVKRVYTQDEVSYCEEKVTEHQCFAGRFAAKEAVIKALGGKIKKYKDISILHTKEGPKVYIKDHPEWNIFVSITHIKELAIAVAIWEG